MSEDDWSLKEKWFKFIPEDIDDSGYIDTFEGFRCCGCDPPVFKEADIIHKDNIKDEIYYPKRDIDALRQKLLQDLLDIEKEDIERNTASYQGTDTAGLKPIPEMRMSVHAALRKVEASINKRFGIEK